MFWDCLSESHWLASNLPCVPRNDDICDSIIDSGSILRDARPDSWSSRGERPPSGGFFLNYTVYFFFMAIPKSMLLWFPLRWPYPPIGVFSAVSPNMLDSRIRYGFCFCALCIMCDWMIFCRVLFIMFS